MALATTQVGVILALQPAANQWLRRTRPWTALTIFLWHMTAYPVVLWAYEGLGGTLLAEPTAGWWAQRWLWLLAPLAVLAVLVALFIRVELATRRPRREATR